MKKNLHVTKAVFKANKNNTSVMELFACMKLEIGKYVESVEGETCGGKEKPPVTGDLGDYFCVAGEWVFFPG